MSFFMELVSVLYRHNECLGLQLFIVKNKLPLASAELAPGFRHPLSYQISVFLQSFKVLVFRQCFHSMAKCT